MPINLDDIKRKYRELKSQPQPQEPRERPKMMPRREPRIEPLEKKPGSPWSSKINRQRSIRKEIMRRVKKSPKEYPERSKRYYA